MASKQDVFKVKKSRWIGLIVTGFILLPCSALMIPLAFEHKIDDIGRLVFALIGLLLIVGAIYAVCHGFSLRKHFIAIDDEGIQEFGKGKVRWSEIIEIKLRVLYNEPIVTIRYRDSSSNSIKKIKTGPKRIYGYKVAMDKIIDHLPEGTLVDIPEYLRK